jgi:hypothetical protein
MEYNDNNEYIRPPDRVVREQLIDYNWKIYDDGDPPPLYEDADNIPFHQDTYDTEPISEDVLQTILESSRLEYETQYNAWLEQMKQEETMKRKSRFENIKRQLLRITKVDVHAPVEYTILLNILSEYEEGRNTSVLGTSMISKIHAIIRSLRVPEQERREFIQLLE